MQCSVQVKYTDAWIGELMVHEIGIELVLSVVIWRCQKISTRDKICNEGGANFTFKNVYSLSQGPPTNHYQPQFTSTCYIGVHQRYPQSLLKGWMRGGASDSRKLSFLFFFTSFYQMDLIHRCIYLAQHKANPLLLNNLYLVNHYDIKW